MDEKLKQEFLQRWAKDAGELLANIERKAEEGDAESQKILKMLFPEYAPKP